MKSYTDKLTELIGFSLNLYIKDNLGWIEGILKELGKNYLLLESELPDVMEDRLIQYSNIKIIQLNITNHKPY